MNAMTLIVLYTIWTATGVRSHETRVSVPDRAACEALGLKTLSATPHGYTVQKIECAPLPIDL